MYICIYVYMYIYICVCVFVCECVCLRGPLTMARSPRQRPAAAAQPRTIAGYDDSHPPDRRTFGKTAKGLERGSGPGESALAQGSGPGG